MYKTTINGQEYEIDFAYFNAGKQLRVWAWEEIPLGDDQEPDRDYTKVYEAIHPLETEFEAFYSWCGDHFGEDVDAEKIAFEMGMPIRSSDDADCHFCAKWEHYSEMIQGTAALPEIQERLALTAFDYVCLDCYTEHTEPCPNNSGTYDCTPFCELCHGNQEIAKAVQDA
jgi:hypothetical protein